MEDNFDKSSRSIEEVLEYTNKMAHIIIEALKNSFEKYYKKDFFLESRIKSETSIKRKMKRDNVSADKVRDILGIRISFATEDECIDCIEFLKEYLGNSISSHIDYFNNPRESGYKAYHFNTHYMGIMIQIQVMTFAMRDWTNMTHDEYLKRVSDVPLENEVKHK